jgi:hypothetical protein
MSKALLTELPPTDQRTANKEHTLAWECAFLGCGALRIWEGGQASFDLPICRRCDSPIARSAADRTVLQWVIDGNLF